MQELQPLPPKKSSNKGLIMVIALIAVVLLAVPCIGVLAAVAIPSFIGYTQRAKTAEARANLSNLHALAASYYTQERWLNGGDVTLTGCTVSTERTSNIPSSQKTVLPASLGPGFDALGFSLYEPVYYQYEIVGAGGCGHGPGESLYSLRAYGDLDGDGVTSLFEISASSDSLNELTRSSAVYTQNELE